jgi:hypothetical protein
VHDETEKIKDDRNDGFIFTCPSFDTRFSIGSRISKQTHQHPAGLFCELDLASNKIKELRDPEIVDPEINSGPASG